MKKAVLGFGVAVVFIIYSFVVRHQASDIVLTPRSSSGQTASTTTTGQSGSSGNSGGTTAGTTYKDGTYTGQEEDAFYGNVKVAVTISGGKITAVKFLEYPNDNPNSIAINQQAVPDLKQEAIQAQSAHVNIISGATDTSEAFVQSLSSALSQAV